MHIVLGGTGHVGSALSNALLEMGESVTVVTHDAAKVPELRKRGLQVEVADVHDVDALQAVFRKGTRLFLLNPPAAPSTDTDAVERRSLASILAAIEDSGLEKIVAESTYGAQPVDRAGDLGILYAMEQSLAAQSIPNSIIRAAYYFSNWDASLETARKDGVHGDGVLRAGCAVLRSDDGHYAGRAVHGSKCAGTRHHLTPGAC